MRTIEKVASLISEKNIVAIYQGRSEAGPRALGNRSFLYDPRDKFAKDFVNTVKKRESYRPFAASIMKEYANIWFDMAGLDESPFMMYAVDARPEVYDIIPGVLHIDKTCRIQTVTEQQNYYYYKLIESFYKITTVPLLFNTSFNLAGETIVETLDDAIDTIKRCDVKYLYLPEREKLCIF
jgi:carbamoyltransferase